MTVVNEAAIRQDIKQWSGLVLTGAWMALASVVLIVVQVAIYLLWPTPKRPVASLRCSSRIRCGDCWRSTCSTW